MKDSKLGVATLHYGFNEGAILQAFSVTQLVNQNISGFSGEIIDQRYPGKLEVYGKANNQRKLSLLDAIENWLPKSTQKFEQNHLSEVEKYILDNYKGIVIGSDVVWSLKYKRHLRRFLPNGIFPNQPYPFFPAFPNLYWPAKNLSIPKFTYAASVGTMNWKEIPKIHKKQMIEIIGEFQLLGVRDERTAEFLNWLNSNFFDRVSIVPDPTLGIDLISEKVKAQLKDKLSTKGVDFNRPTIGIVTSEAEEMIKVVDYFKKSEYQIINISTYNTFGGIDLFNEDINPIEWANIFGLFDFYIVDRMHASIFSLKNQKPFVALDNYETIGRSFSKTKSLMNRYGLLDFCVPKSSLQNEQIIELSKEIFKNYTTKYQPEIKRQLKKDQDQAKSYMEKIEQCL
jgi:hypothetical protein